MSRLAPLELDQIEDPELRDLTAQCVELGVPDELFPRIIARVPAQAKTLLGVMLELHTKGTVDHQLKEIIRIQLARFVEDPYFSALRSKQAIAAGLTEERIDAGCDDYEDSELFTEAERIILQKIALAKLQALELGCTINVPKGECVFYVISLCVLCTFVRH